MENDRRLESLEIVEGPWRVNLYTSKTSGSELLPRYWLVHDGLDEIFVECYSMSALRADIAEIVRDLSNILLDIDKLCRQNNGVI